MLNNKKYSVVRNKSVYEKHEESDGSISGQYRSLCVSPIPYRVVNSLKISATDSHRTPSYIATLPIGRISYRPLYFNSKIKGNRDLNVYSKPIHLIPKDLFELLPESKVDPDFVSNARKVCQSYCSDETVFLPNSHTANLELNNRLTTSGQEVSQYLQSKPRFSKKGFHDEDSEKSSVFTLVGRKLINSDKNTVKTETDENLTKTTAQKQCEGTYFTVLASPKVQNRNENPLKSDQNFNIKSIETEKLNKETDSKPVDNSFTNDNSEKDSHNKDVKVSVNEKLNFKLTVPQEVTTQSIKEFCRGIIDDKHVNQITNIETYKKINTDQNKTYLSDIGQYDQRKQLTTLKSPTIVKEVMKKIASIPSGGFDQNVDIKVTESQTQTAKAQNRCISVYESQTFTANDTEAMLVIQELDRSIAEGSPSNANSPVIVPRIYEKIIVDNKSHQMVKMGLRPNKPPRLLGPSISMNSKRKMMLEVTETQTDNLIEEVYFADENGTKSPNLFNDQTKHKFIEMSSQQNTRLLSQRNTKQHEFENPYKIENYIQNYENGNNLNLNSNVKHHLSSTNDLECAIARSSLSSVDSGTSSPHSTHFIVVAIDFGTTYSGYSFCFTQDPDNIQIMRKVEGCDIDVSNQKIPTILLLNPDGVFHSFGFAARDHYSSLEPKDAKRYFYFEKFKLNLHYDESLSLETKIKATNGNKSFSAISVFAHALRYFKSLALREISDQSGTHILNEDIRWVLTVPAIWKPSAKQFMREAAYEAGIGSHENPYQLLIALEPEAASIYCRRLKMHQLVPTSPPRRHSLFPERRNSTDEEMAVDCESDMFLSLQALNCSHNETVENKFSKGTKYLVVDVGGGTVDITCHQIQTKQGSLKELHKATGGIIAGSIAVDVCFEKLLSDIFGVEFMTQFKTKRPSGYVDLMSAFESRKRSSSPSQSTPSNISLPFSFINFFKKSRGCTVEQAVKKYSGNKNSVNYNAKQGMLRLEPSLMQQLFEPVTKKIINHIADVLNNKLVKDVSYLFLVGGFAESQILQSTIRNAFCSHLKVIIPQSPSLCVMKGASIYGINPSVITCRRSTLTYGVGVLNRFDRNKHPIHKLTIKDNIEWCADVFDAFVHCDQSLDPFETITRLYTPVNEFQTCSIIHIYCSEKDNIQFITDEGVRRCGTLYLDLDFINRSNHINPAFKREIKTQMIFGDTEIKVTALDVSTGKYVKAEIDFLKN